MLRVFSFGRCWILGEAVVGDVVLGRAASAFGNWYGFPEHPAVANTYAIELLASPGAIPHVFNAGVNSVHVGER